MMIQYAHTLLVTTRGKLQHLNVSIGIAVCEDGAMPNEKLEILSRELPNSLAVPADMTKISEIKKMVEQTEEH